MVNAYQRVLAWVPQSEFHFADKPIVRPGHFFGFHDKCPWSLDGQYLLSHSFRTQADVGTVERMPISYGVFEGDDLQNYRVLGQTAMWNWQQGASLQWISGSEQAFAVNTAIDGKPCADVRDINGRTLNSVPYHLASVQTKGRHGVSYCFRRLGRGAPGYGYPLLGDGGGTESDALGVVDLQSGRYAVLLTLRDVANMDFCKTMAKAYHFFSHALFSPDGARILFFHQWRQPKGVLGTRLYSIGVGGNDLYRFPGLNFSHITWHGDREVLAYCNPGGGQWGYHIARDGDGAWCRLGGGMFTSDGHPQCTEDGRYMVTDSYPDRFRQQRLFIYDLELGKGKEVARLKIPFEYRGTRRCDFHPRWSRDGRSICFDSAHLGVRALCVLSIGSSN